MYWNIHYILYSIPINFRVVYKIFIYDKYKMPYKVVKVSNGFKVKKSQPGRPRYFSKKPLTKKMAMQQAKALYVSESKIKK